jgi:hypothetical protein
MSAAFRPPSGAPTRGSAVGSRGRNEGTTFYARRARSVRPHDRRAGTVGDMSSRMQTRRQRRLLALVLAAAAVGLMIMEPFPKGKVLLSLTSSHGVDAGDIPAVALLLLAAVLAI